MACQLKNILILVRRVSLVIKCAIARSGEILFTTHVNGGIAQLVERPFCTRKVSGSNPLASTILRSLRSYVWHAIFFNDWIINQQNNQSEVCPSKREANSAFNSNSIPNSHMLISCTFSKRSRAGVQYFFIMY